MRCRRGAAGRSRAIVSWARSACTVVSVATEAAIDTDENQNDPVVKIRCADRRNVSDPTRADSG